MAATLTTIDQQALGEERLLSEYGNATNLKAYHAVYMVQMQELEDMFQSFFTKFNPLTASGDQLDILGRIVDQSRVLTNAGAYPWFGPITQTGALGYGDANDPNNTSYLGGRFRSFSEQIGKNELLSDEEYRLFIQAKIEANGGGTSVEEVIANIKSLFPQYSVSVVRKTNSDNIGANITIHGTLTDFEKAYITGNDITITTAGLPFNYFDDAGPIA